MAPRDLHRGGARLVRGAVLGACCAWLSMAAHAAAGGTVLSAGLLLTLAVAMGLGVAWAERRGTRLRLVAFVVGCEVLLHIVGSLLGSHHPGNALVPTMPMLLSHALAAIVLAFLLAHADGLAHRWVEFLRHIARPVPMLPQLPVSGVIPVLEACVTALATQTPSLLFARRGPPAFELR